MEAMHINKLQAFYKHQFQPSSSSLKVCVSNRKDNERPDILIYQAEEKEKIKHGNLDNCWLKGSQKKDVSETRSEMEIQWLLASNNGI